jgi:hypothetical protein
MDYGREGAAFQSSREVKQIKFSAEHSPSSSG